MLFLILVIKGSFLRNSGSRWFNVKPQKFKKSTKRETQLVSPYNHKSNKRFNREMNKEKTDLSTMKIEDVLNHLSSIINSREISKMESSFDEAKNKIWDNKEKNSILGDHPRQLKARIPRKIEKIMEKRKKLKM